ncbi:hypothetical protein [Klebsiella pneumoniae]|uniref:hypothetical protein n=1 Tax=Klebsiella pneumoniae TaxID=573 RepID=UPI002041FBFF|nr:hypothetical protein [Klebsiella pneumoniae]USB67212.1 hypothetical protein KU669_10660 [Klebsiella pneumoniae]HBT4924921.1 hypothetical protein [Klebsiella pneumoniae]
MNIYSIPVWVTINEAVELINQAKFMDKKIKAGDIYRYALYGHLTLSIYFQSPIKLRRVVTHAGAIQYDKINGDIVERLCHLCLTCFQNNDNVILRTEGDYITPSCYILDASLSGRENLTLQKLLARSLDLPPPVTGLYDIHHGVLVNDGGYMYQVFESCSWESKISRRLKKLRVNTDMVLYDEIKNKSASKSGMGCFPVYHLPDDAWFVIRPVALEEFIDTCFPSREKISTQISTPLSRMLWLACKHNDKISSLIEHPYKLVSVFEQWALSDGITDRLSGDTLKKALKRGAPL